MPRLTHCYNKGCGIEFDPEVIANDACRYHPGDPVFHDAKKKWSCCQKYSTDFTEFLNIKGCKVGPHNRTKPTPIDQPPKIAEEKLGTQAPPQKPPSPVLTRFPRPSPDDVCLPLPVIVSASLSNALKACEEDRSQAASGDASDASIPISSPCFNSGCKSTYAGPVSNTEICLYHPGVPVFHEGMKFWSCCQRKTSEFTSFMEQVGCTSGTHNWSKETAATTNMMASLALSDCRFDWFQLPDSITVSIYAKRALPESVKIQCNGVFLSVDFVYEIGKLHFQRFFQLFGVVSPNSSRVSLSATKVEIVLKKAEPRAWSSLELPAQTKNGDQDTPQPVDT